MSRGPQGDHNLREYDPRDRDYNYRPTLRGNHAASRRNYRIREARQQRYETGSNQPEMAPQNIIRNRGNYQGRVRGHTRNRRYGRAGNQNLTRVRINIPVIINPNPRNKAIRVTYERKKNEALKTLLAKIRDDLKIDLNQINGLGIGEPKGAEETIYLLARSEELYTKATERMKTDQMDAYAGASTEETFFFYHAPEDLKSPLAAGELHASTVHESPFPTIRLTDKGGAPKDMIQALTVLKDWYEAKDNASREFIVQSIRAIKINKSNFTLTFASMDLCNDFKAYMSQSLHNYEIETEIYSLVFLQSNGPSQRNIKRALRISDEVLAILSTIGSTTPQLLEAYKSLGAFNPNHQETFKILGNMTEESLDWFRQMGTNHYEVIERPNIPQEVNNLTQQLQTVNNPAQDTMDTN